MTATLAVVVLVGCPEKGLEGRRGPNRELRVESTPLLPVPDRATLAPLDGHRVTGDTVVVASAGPRTFRVGRGTGPNEAILVELVPSHPLVEAGPGRPVRIEGWLRAQPDAVGFYVEADRFELL